MEIYSTEWHELHRKITERQQKKLKNTTPKKEIQNTNSMQENLKLNEIPKTINRFFENKRVKFFQKVVFCQYCGCGFIIHKNNNFYKFCSECKKIPSRIRQDNNIFELIEKQKKGTMQQYISNDKRIIIENIPKKQTVKEKYKNV